MGHNDIISAHFSGTHQPIDEPLTFDLRMSSSGFFFLRSRGWKYTTLLYCTVLLEILSSCPPSVFISPSFSCLSAFFCSSALWVEVRETCREKNMLQYAETNNHLIIDRRSEWTGSEPSSFSSKFLSGVFQVTFNPEKCLVSSKHINKPKGHL